MKSKKSLYILIPTVIIIWSLIIYKIFNYQNKSFIVEQPAISFNIPDSIETVTDTLAFIARYRDPFLGRLKSQATVVKKEKGNQNRINYQQKQAIKVYVNWPKIDYNGMIYSTENNRLLALININRCNYLMNKTQKIEQCKLLMISPDSIIMSFKTDKKTFYK